MDTMVIAIFACVIAGVAMYYAYMASKKAASSRKGLVTGGAFDEVLKRVTALESSALGWSDVQPQLDKFYPTKDEVKLALQELEHRQLDADNRVGEVSDKVDNFLQGIDRLARIDDVDRSVANLVSQMATLLKKIEGVERIVTNDTIDSKISAAVSQALVNMPAPAPASYPTSAPTVVRDPVTVVREPAPTAVIDDDDFDIEAFVEEFRQEFQNVEGRSARAVLAVRAIEQFLRQLEVTVVARLRKPFDVEAAKLESWLREHLEPLETAKAEAEAELANKVGKRLVDDPTESQLEVEANRHVAAMGLKSLTEMWAAKMAYAERRPTVLEGQKAAIRAAEEKLRRATAALEEFHAGEACTSREARMQELRGELSSFERLSAKLVEIQQQMEPRNSFRPPAPPASPVPPAPPAPSAERRSPFRETLQPSSAGIDLFGGDLGDEGDMPSAYTPAAEPPASATMTVSDDEVEESPPPSGDGGLFS
ncbi:hypothetical protein KJ657_03060 [Patescibacteria group bacterium]|nr:hypothetical protein [Patescibacteria group bacterium]